MHMRAMRLLRDESGFLMRGWLAVAFLVLMFIMALTGAIPWVAFFVILVVSAILTGIRAAIG